MLLPLRFGAVRTFATTRFYRANKMATTNLKGLTIRFGPFTVTDQVFLKTEFSFALVNLKPLVPGHTLVCPIAPHLRFTDLSPAETADLFNTVQLLQRLLAKQHFPAPREGEDAEKNPTGSFTIGLQDGPEAGQTVPHVHVHVIPRTKGDMPQNDDVYAGMASEKGNVGGALWDMQKRPTPIGAPPSIEDEDRAARSVEDMNEEAARYKAALQEMGVE